MSIERTKNALLTSKSVRQFIAYTSPEKVTKRRSDKQNAFHRRLERTQLSERSTIQRVINIAPKEGLSLSRDLFLNFQTSPYV